ncbi:MAG: hypothetical protein ACFFC7_13380 [Candidatus Hermodarchaeota archaeon]
MVTKSDIETHFRMQLKKINRQGDLGISNFQSVYEDLMPVQQKRLKQICGTDFQKFLEQGSFICIALAYYETEIANINQRTAEGRPNKKIWNIYAKAYDNLNRILNWLIEELALLSSGIPILATLEGMVSTVQHVRNYFPLTISHRQIAEHAGLGWRGKNGLVIHPRYSCAVRYASVITHLPLPHNKKLSLNCGDCTACFDVCSFLKNRKRLKDYRESCRKYIKSLNLAKEVCGKCVLACYGDSIFKNQFQLLKTGN